MKKLIHVFVFILIYSSLSSQPVTSGQFTSSEIIAHRIKNSPSDNSIAQANPGWSQKVQSIIEKKEYQFNKLDNNNKYGVVNRKNQKGFVIDGATFITRPIIYNPDNLAANWSSGLSFRSISKGDGLIKASGIISSTNNSNKLVYQYKGFQVEYINDTTGLRQNFIVQQNPASKGALQVNLAITGDLIGTLAGNNTLQLADNKANTILQYDDLKVWDANNKPLAAQMQLNSKQELSIVVDDHNATYPVTIDPLNHAPNWQGQGQGLLFPLLNDLSLHVLYGFNVSDAGDVNGDGFGDVIIGAPAYVEVLNVGDGNFTAASVGAAFIYYGSSTGLSVSPNEVLQPNTTVAGALFGFSVSTAGDINGDGKSDVIIGAPADQVSYGFLMNNLKVGRVYVYYGSTFDGIINTEPTVSVTLNLRSTDISLLSLAVANPLYGFSVSEAGDVNGDGYKDVVVGSPAYTSLSILPLSAGLLGRVDVYLGSSSGLSTTPTSISGGLLGGLFGFSVSTAGNVNNDKISGRDVSDIIVGAPGSLGLLNVGRAFIFHGSASGITASSIGSANATISPVGLLTGTLFGYSVSNAGNVNNDNYGDVIIGEPLSLEQFLSESVSVGAAHILYGSATGVTGTGITTLTSPRRPSLLGILQGNLLFGFSVSGVGDVTCDGIDDVIIGEPGGTGLSLGTGLLNLVSTNAISGRAYVYEGRNSTGPANTPHTTINETDPLSIANLIGYSVSGAGDVNGDGKNDILIGAPNGSLNLGANLLSVLTNVIDYVTVNSVGRAYELNACLCGTSKPSDYFRTVQSGNWNNVTSWESSPDGIRWCPATLTPDYVAKTITVRNAHTITVTQTVVVDETTVALGGKIIINSPVNFEVVDGPGHDLTVNGSMDIIAGGHLVFKSTAAGTASLGGSACTITGEAVVERYISSLNNRAYRLLASTVNTVGSSKPFILQNWQEGSNNTNPYLNSNPVPGFGTHITGSINGANGLDATRTGEPSLYIYNPTGINYVPAINTNNTSLDAKTGYMMYLRGDRSLDLTSEASPLPTANTTLRATGTLVCGTQQFNLAAAPECPLATNPFPSPINWNSIYGHSANATNFFDFYIYWDPNIGTRGGYVNVNGSGISSPASGATQDIQSGQAFFVKSRAGITSPVLTINETDKSTVSNNNVFRVKAPSQMFSTSLYFNDAVLGRRLADGFTIIYDSSYRQGADEADAEELENWDENIAVSKHSLHYSISSSPVIAGNDTVKIFMSNMKQRAYEFDFNATNMQQPALTAELVDSYTGSHSPISLSLPVTIRFSVDQNAASSDSSRFYIVFRAAAPLPLKLLSLQAVKEGQTVNVKWIADDDVSVDNYDVQKSSKGTDFISLTTIKQAGIAGRNTYGIVDQSPSTGTNFYRLVSTFRDGRTETSPVVKVQFASTAGEVKIFPNPVEKNKVVLHFAQLKTGTYNITFRTIHGQAVQRNTIKHDGTTNTYILNVAGIPAGVYQVGVHGKDVSINQAIIKN